MNALLDSFLSQKMSEYKVPGLVFVLIENDEVVFKKGYGYSSLESKKAVDPDHSIFRVAAISELFTEIALLQLIDKKHLHLNEDVARYLPFPVHIKNRFASSLQIQHLLTHSDGFEERTIGAVTLDPAQLPTLKECVRKSIKPIIIPPGQTITYGSFGSILASLLIESLSYMPFEEYMEKNIFKPLDMTSSTMRQKELVENHSDEIVTTYLRTQDGFQPLPFLYATGVAAEGASVTGHDMGKFLIALLEQRSDLLKPSAFSSLFHQQFTSHPDLPGVTHGFFEYTHDGQCLVWDGTGMGITSRIFLIPKTKTGFFIACNAACMGMVEELTQTVFSTELGLDEDNDPKGNGISYLAGEQPFAPTIQKVKNRKQITEETRLKNLEGVYRYINYSRHTVMKLNALFAGLLNVKKENDQTISISALGKMGDPYGFGQKSSQWKHLHLDVWEKDNGFGRVVFQKNKLGQVTHLLSGIGYHTTYEKLAWYQLPVFHFGLIGLFFFLFLSGALWATLSSCETIWTNRIAGLLHLMNLFCIIISIPWTVAASVWPSFPAMAFVEGFGIRQKIAWALPWMSVAVTLVLLGMLDAAWQMNDLPTKCLVYSIGSVIISVAFLIYLKFWNLLRGIGKW